MSSETIHSVNESSCFYQGAVKLFFTRRFGKSLSFQIIDNDPDPKNEYNFEKYRKLFSTLINRKIALRVSLDGAQFHQIGIDDLKIKPIKLIDNVKDEGRCGIFLINPQTALCTQDGCNQYFNLKEGRKCGHSDKDDWQQFTFLAFCDVCGKIAPLHAMTNINVDCDKCGAKKSMNKLIWPKGKEDIGSYKVMCNKCGHKKSLHFVKCHHENGLYSGKPQSSFRAVPATANSVTHPYVISIPDIPASEGLNQIGMPSAQGSLLTEAFINFYGYEFDQSKLYLPEFRQKLISDNEFWSIKKVDRTAEDVIENITLNPLESDINENMDLVSKYFTNIIEKILIDAKIAVQTCAVNNTTTSEQINLRYGIDKIRDALKSVENIPFDEQDLQGFNLINAKNKRMKPQDFPNYEDILSSFGLEGIYYYPDLTIVQATLGVIYGSTRKPVLLYMPIESGMPNNKKPTVFVRNYSTEGILFKLNHEKVIEWLDSNKELIKPEVDIFPIKNNAPLDHLRDLINLDEACKNAVYKLLHTYSHMLIQQSSVDTGLDARSISEIIYPKTASIFLYSTNSINIGGLEFVYEYNLKNWFHRVNEIAEDCPQDPACMIDEGGACNSCCYLPEFVCCNFNSDLDRSTLVGNSDRFKWGYLK
ncbi:hypothetical protein [Methanococcoides sp. FTZ1]|uniref:hypothetical protein n=1 Tax=Methanococcoides sp. FTZ1 TaxID=3439061 RepID=UPI003F82F593